MSSAFSTHRLHKESLEEKLDKREDEDLISVVTSTEQPRVETIKMHYYQSEDNTVGYICSLLEDPA